MFPTLFTLSTMQLPIGLLLSRRWMLDVGVGRLLLAQPSALSFVTFSNSGAARSAPAENPRAPTRPYRDSKRREAMPSNAEEQTDRAYYRRKGLITSYDR